jgi:hypothetical protein
MYEAPTIRFGLPWRQPENPPNTVAPEVLIAPETAAPRDAEAAETMARAERSAIPDLEVHVA